MKTIFGCLLVLSIVACDKVDRNERKMAGNWELEKMTTTVYQDNQVISEKDSTYYGVLQLLNGEGTDLNNMAFFEGFDPLGESLMNWTVSYGKIRTLQFYLFDDNTGYVSATYNVEHHSSKRLVLTYYIADADINVNKKISHTFIRKH